MIPRLIPGVPLRRRVLRMISVLHTFLSPTYDIFRVLHAILESYIHFLESYLNFLHFIEPYIMHFEVLHTFLESYIHFRVRHTLLESYVYIQHF